MEADVRIFSRRSLENQIFHGGRKLMSAPSNCTPRALDEFPGDFFTEEQRQSGGVIIHFIISIYLFIGLAIICDDYFVPSVEQISEKLHLQPDVAGATFMAAGSSAPELFTSMIGVFIAENDVGTGTIVGSAVFNILCIVALIALFAGMVLELTWYPMCRDSVVYMFSVAVLIIVINDGAIYWYEALIMLAMYAGYITIMYFNSAIQSIIIGKFYSIYGGQPYSETQQRMHGEYDTIENQSIKKEEDGPYNPFEMPDSFIKRCLWLTMLPLSSLIFITCPDCRRPGKKSSCSFKI